MPKYIDAEKAKMTFKKMNFEGYGAESLNAFTHYAISQMIDNTEAEDVKPVIHGHWIKKTYPCEELECSVCGHIAWCDTQGIMLPSFYCPNCGAEMGMGAEG